MDMRRSQALKKQLAAQPQPWLVPIAQFFDGNDDLASIGCNLDDHPGVEAFRAVLTGLLGRPDVEAVYAQIAELDPGGLLAVYGHGTCRRQDFGRGARPRGEFPRAGRGRCFRSIWRFTFRRRAPRFSCGGRVVGLRPTPNRCCSQRRGQEGFLGFSVSAAPAVAERGVRPPEAHRMSFDLGVGTRPHG